MIGGWLLANHKITGDEHATYHWKGIPKALRSRIEGRLLALEPLRDMSSPFAVADVIAAAEKCFQRDRFDSGLVYSDSDSDSESASYDSDDETESSELESSSSEEERKKPHRKTSKTKKTRTKTHRKHKSSADSSEDEAPTKAKAKSTTRKKPTNAPVPQDEVEELIQQLNKMAIDDKRYGLLYFRAVKLDRSVKEVVRAPKLQSNTNEANTTGGVRNGQRTTTSANGNKNNMNTAPQYPTNSRTTGCFGCGVDGHTLYNCPVIEQLVTSGRATRDRRGRLATPDGQTIRRQGDETLVQAMERATTAPAAHLVTGNRVPEQWVFPNDEDDDEPVYVVPLASDSENEGVGAYPVERNEKGTRRVRREQFDAVCPPTLSEVRERQRAERKARERRAEERGKNVDVPSANAPRKEGMGQKNIPDPSKIPPPFPIPVRPAPTIPTAPSIPKGPAVRDDEMRVDAPARRKEQPTRKDYGDEDIMEEDKDTRKRPEGRKNGNEDKSKNESKVNPSEFEPRRNVPRRSELAAHVDPKIVLQKLLQTPVQMAVGEILGVSKELSNVLTENLRSKPLRPDTPRFEAHSIWTKTRGLLIRLRMHCDEKPITAIIDTGSQLNIVNRNAWKTIINRPMDIAKSMSMNDANGGEGLLRGLVPNVPLHCGGVVTEASLFVGEHVPFQLLLGRPWQRGNFVSIDEHQDGTYLLFKDSGGNHVQFEVLVTPD
ncbi:hypothetical protein BJ138DRAFT_1199218, partial [Hygrophoropsis aurantiaca]